MTSWDTQNADPPFREAETIRRIVESTQDFALCLLDRDGRVVTWSEANERIKGYAAPEIMGQNFAVFYPPEDVAAGKPQSALAAATATGRFEDEGWRVRKDGSRVWANVIITPMHHDAGGLRGYAKLTRDLTGRLETDRVIRRAHDSGRTRRERRLEAACAAAEAANAAKSQFLAVMTHELRTPLTSLIGFSELMLRQDFRPDQLRHFLTLQRNAAVALSSLVTNILDFSKIEAGKFELEMLPFEPRAVIAGCEDLVGQPIAAKGLVLQSVIDDSVPHWAMGDPTRLRQVILNLLTNAVKFTQAGSIVLTARMEGGRLRVSVKDSGIGVPAALLNRLFQPFSQADISTSRRFGGSGLGLAICSRIVGQMGGTIGVESETGRGSLFWFEIPLQAAARPVEDGAAGPGPQPAKSRRVLLAEDNPTNQLLITSMLETVGHQVAVVEDGAAAVDAAGTGVFDVILLDLQMPVMGGFEAARRIRAVERDGRRLPIIALTANATSLDVEECRVAGMDDFLAKPIDMDMLIATVARW